MGPHKIGHIQHRVMLATLYAVENKGLVAWINLNTFIPLGSNQGKRAAVVGRNPLSVIDRNIPFTLRPLLLFQGCPFDGDIVQGPMGADHRKLELGRVHQFPGFLINKIFHKGGAGKRRSRRKHIPALEDISRTHHVAHGLARDVNPRFIDIIFLQRPRNQLVQVSHIVRHSFFSSSCLPDVPGFPFLD